MGTRAAVTGTVFLATAEGPRALRLGKLLGEGAAGKVYAVPAMPGRAAKLYHGAKECRAHEAKIDVMLANPPELPAGTHGGRSYSQLAWPEAKLFDDAGSFVGFLMPEIDFARSTSLVNLLQKNSRRIEKISEYYGYRVLVARNLASVFAELHRAGHHMIDMKPANLRFYPDVSWMAVVDTDGFSVAAGGGKRVPAEQVSDEYIAPESWTKPVRALGEAQDLFALAVIIFQLLNNGVHPFAGSARDGQATDLQARIQAGLYPYALTAPEALSPSTASVHRMFRRATRALFDRAFTGGTRRPTAAEWRDHLDELLTLLVPCAAKPSEHVHFGNGCGYCGHDARVAASAKKASEAARRVAAASTRANGARNPVPRRLQPRTSPRLRGPLANHALAPAGRRRRRRPVKLPWRGAVALALLAAFVISSDSAIRWIFPAEPASARVASFGPREGDIPQVQRFEMPRLYIVLPAEGRAQVAMREGPGAEYPLVARLDRHEDVLGRGISEPPEGKESWVEIIRGIDGATGFVPATSLLRREDKPGRAAIAALPPEADRCASGSDSLSRDCGNAREAAVGRDIARRFRDLAARARGYDRFALIESQRAWELARRECAASPLPRECRQLRDLARLDELDRWRLTPTSSDSRKGGDAPRATSEASGATTAPTRL